MNVAVRNAVCVRPTRWEMGEAGCDVELREHRYVSPPNQRVVNKADINFLLNVIENRGGEIMLEQYRGMFAQKPDLMALYKCADIEDLGMCLTASDNP